ncbi:MAG: lytic transglycosylase domain-containing protein [Asticcacaulis sp.]
MSLLLSGLAVPSAAQVFELSDDGQFSVLCASLPPSATPASEPAATSVPFESEINAAARDYQLSADLIGTLIRQESGFNASAVSPRGAIGLMQLMPATARELGVDPRDPAANIRGGAAYLRRQLDRFEGRLDLALAAYNAGAGAVDRHGGIPPYAETLTYISRILDRLSTKADPVPARRTATPCS